MKIWRPILLALSLLLSTSVLGLEPVELGIVTGPETGTYFRFGEDLKRLVASHGISLAVYTSSGSVENMVAVYDSRSIQLGIAQSDVVAFMNASTEPRIRRIEAEARLVLPLYVEEAHLLARPELSRFEDLAGKTVAIGSVNSGTAMTARVFFALTRVQPAELLEIGGQQALAALREGVVDAMFYVAGQPVALFTELLSPQDQFRLLNIRDSNILKFYRNVSVIPAATYMGQSEDVETVGVVAGLMTLDYRSDDPSCAHIARIYELIRGNLDWLRQNGHEKWKSLEFDAPVAGELWSPCAASGS
jgi:TRAP transporter TAXI family solute receptor